MVGRRHGLRGAGARAARWQWRASASPSEASHSATEASVGANATEASAGSSTTTVYVALAGNVLVAITKFVAAGLSGSASMLSEAVHSVVDTLNELLLLYGLRRSAQPADADHPLGHGREIYFWSFVVAVLLFALGAGVSVYQGIDRIRHPAPTENAIVNYIVLALSAVFEGISWHISLRAFRTAKGELGYWEGFRISKDPPTFTVLFEDTAALVGIAVAAAATFASDTLGMPIVDGIASLVIGGVLAVTAALLARESKDLLIGERAGSRVTGPVESLVAAEPAIVAMSEIVAIQLGPTQVVVAISVEFDAALRTREIEAAVARLEQRLRSRVPEIVALFVKPQMCAGDPCRARRLRGRVLA
jgi:cation diffusion facilitator family transporter